MALLAGSVIRLMIQEGPSRVYFPMTMTGHDQAYPLLNDIIFKIVFGTEASRPVLRALLNALLGLTGDERISELTILNPWIDKEYLVDKDAILDVKAKDAAGRLYNIEVQLASRRA